VSETLLERSPVPRAANPLPEPIRDSPPPGPMTSARVVTSLLVAGPLVALAVFIPLGWGGTKTIWGLGLAGAFYLFTGFGISVGFHRLFAHRSFRAHRVLKIVLAVAGTMALEGSVISWVTTHRRHHVFSDRPGDPHSPVSYGTDKPTATRGFL
jgi:stearoyl-CoA desaturase (Delta-9 desaturase)